MCLSISPPREPCALIILVWASWAVSSLPAKLTLRELAHKYQGRGIFFDLDVSTSATSAPRLLEISPASQKVRASQPQAEGMHTALKALADTKISVVPTWIITPLVQGATDDTSPASAGHAYPIVLEGAQPKFVVADAIEAILSRFR